MDELRTAKSHEMAVAVSGGAPMHGGSSRGTHGRDGAHEPGHVKKTKLVVVDASGRGLEQPDMSGDFHNYGSGRELVHSQNQQLVKADGASMAARGHCDSREGSNGRGYFTIVYPTTMIKLSSCGKTFYISAEIKLLMPFQWHNTCILR